MATKSAWPSLTIASAWRASQMRPTATVTIPLSLSHAFREGCLVTRALGDGHERDRPGHERDRPGHAARRADERIDATRLQCAGEFDRIVERPAALGPVRRRTAEEKRPVVRPRLANTFRDLQRKPHPVGKAAPIRILPPVRKRREELVDEETVAAVYLGNIEAGLGRAVGCGTKGVLDARDPFLIEGFGHDPAFTDRDRGRGNERPRPFAARGVRLRRVGTCPPRRAAQPPCDRNG